MAHLTVGACGAKLRNGGGMCVAPPVAGKRRCHAHGGAPGSGAPHGNKNAQVHGNSTRYSRRAAVSRPLRARLREKKTWIRRYLALFSVPEIRLNKIWPWKPQQMQLRFARWLIRLERHERHAREVTAPYSQNDLAVIFVVAQKELIGHLCDSAEVFESKERLGSAIRILRHVPLLPANVRDKKVFEFCWNELCDSLLSRLTEGAVQSLGTASGVSEANELAEGLREMLQVKKSLKAHSRMWNPKVMMLPDDLRSALARSRAKPKDHAARTLLGALSVGPSKDSSVARDSV